RVNEGYQTLKKPLSRAKYLLELAGHDLAAETNTAMPTSFLMEQMEWRETLSDARAAGDMVKLEHLEGDLQKALDHRYTALVDVFSAADWPVAAERIRCLMFLEKLSLEINDALADLE
ncbi:MAG: Fe-S protein assembly co-chaperone HscB, partial [Pseudomonadota bacterium]